MAQSLARAPASLESDPRRLRRADPSWDFRGEDTKYATHGIYRYPAMMVAPVVRFCYYPGLSDCRTEGVTIRVFSAVKIQAAPARARV